MFGIKLQLGRKPRGRNIAIDTTPSGEEEEEFLFDNPVDDPRDINEMVLRERLQNMGERLLFADRAFFVTLVWVFFLVALTLLQMLASIWGVGLSDPQFVTVVTTTTASVFGFWFLVGKYLHHQDEAEAARKAEGKKPE